VLENLLKARANIEDKLAVEDLKLGCFKYSQLDELSEDLASRLSKSVKQSDKVCAIAQNSVYYLALFFALRKLGATLVPINPNVEKKMIEQILKDTKPKVIIDEHFGYGVKFDELLNSQGIDYENKQSDIAMILYTGGTTGKPKGALIPERQIVWNAINTVFSWNIGANDRTFNTMPMHHTAGWNVLTLPLLFCGGSVILDSGKFDPGKTIDVLSTKGCTVYMGVPTMLDAISKHPSFQVTDLSRVVFISGGGVLSPRVFERFKKRGLKIFQGYGLTEAGPNNFYISPERFAKKPWSVGKPMLFVQAKLDKTGELLIKGPHVFQGYLGKEENPFDSEGYLHTGDVFCIDEEGDFFFVDRIKDVIKTGGENVYSTEVERVILENAYVKEAAVIGVPDEHWGEKVVAFLVCEKPLNVEELKQELRKKLASYKIPKDFVFVESLPKSSFGKVLKSELRRMYEKGGGFG
jgi:Acyl-CoA synthetases (AMP-forming)/AMP-acid ligases II